MEQIGEVRQRSHLFKSQRGFTLIEALVAVGIGSIVTLGIATMITNMNKEVKQLSDKMSLQSTNLVVQTMFMNSEYCACLMAGSKYEGGGSTAIFNSMPTRVPAGYTGSCVANSESAIPPVGQTIPGTTFRVDEIKWTSVSELSPGNFKVKLSVKVSSPNAIRAFVPLEQNLVMQFNSSTKLFQACGNAPVVPNRTEQVPGDMCGMGTRGSRQNDRNPFRCKGYNPATDGCPAGYAQQFIAEADYVYFYTCIKQ